LTPSLSGESSHLYNFDIHINATEKVWDLSGKEFRGHTEFEV
jgi:hypothetical protein